MSYGPLGLDPMIKYQFSTSYKADYLLYIWYLEKSLECNCRIYIEVETQKSKFWGKSEFSALVGHTTHRLASKSQKIKKL